MNSGDLEAFRKFVLRESGLPVPNKRSSVALPKDFSTVPKTTPWRGRLLLVLFSDEAQQLCKLLGKQSTRPHRIFEWCYLCHTWQPVGKFGQHERSHRIAKKATLAIAMTLSLPE